MLGHMTGQLTIEQSGHMTGQLSLQHTRWLHWDTVVRTIITIDRTFKLAHCRWKNILGHCRMHSYIITIDRTIN